MPEAPGSGWVLVSASLEEKWDRASIQNREAWKAVAVSFLVDTWAARGTETELEPWLLEDLPSSKRPTLSWRKNCFKDVLAADCAFPLF